MARPERPLDAGDTPLLRFAADLRTLRWRAGNPTYRELSKLANYSTAVLCEAAGGRKFPSKAVTLAFVTACEGDTDEWATRWRKVADHLAPSRLEPDTERSPYPGLAAFQISDADRFFGRENLRKELLDRLREHRFIGVFGASGSGKSSLLRAGLAAAVTGPVVVLTPGPDPLHECAARLSDLVGESPAVLRAEFAADRAGLHRRISQALADRREDLLLVVDQFEEVFTLGADQAPFIDALVHATNAEGSRVRVVLGVRADFFGHCGSVPALREALRDRTVLVGAMTPEELREAVARPATDAGLTIETALVNRILADAGKEAGALPLVSHALRETWQRRQGIALTLAAYEAAGGIQHAIARTAEAVFTRLDAEQQAVARQVFLRLVALGDEDTKRRLNRAELDAGSEAVLAALTASRLITVDQDHVEITHEALISHWPRLRDWLGEDREGLRTHRLLTEATAEWKALNRDAGALYRGARLALTQDWLQRTRTRLSIDERAFLDASAATSRRQSRRLVRLVVLLVVLLVAVSGTTAYSLREQGRTADALHRETLQQVESAVLSESPMNPTDVAALAVADYQSDPTPQHRGQLFRWWYQGWTTPPRTPRTMAVLDPTGSFSASVTDTATIALAPEPADWPRKEIPAHGATVESIAVASDGKHVAVSYQDDVTDLWNTAGDPVLQRTWTGRRTYLSFSPDGRTLAIGETTANWRQDVSRYPQLELWNVNDLTVPVRTFANSWGQAAFAADAPRVAVRSMERGDGIRVYATDSAPTQLPLATRSDMLAPPMALSPDGGTVVMGAFDPHVPISMYTVQPDGDVKEVEEPVPAGGGTLQPVFSRDGTYVILPDDANGIAVWDIRDPHHPHEYAALSGWKGQVLAAAVSPDRRLTIITTETQLAVTLDVGSAIAGICGHLKENEPHVAEMWPSFAANDVLPMPCQQ